MPTYINAETAYSQLTNSMQQSPTWKTDSSLASQEISLNLWNFKIGHRVHKSQLLFLRWNTPDHALPTDFLEIHFNIIFQVVSFFK
jgi:hypothetical protein